MCEIIGQVVHQAIERRRFLAGTGASGLTAVFDAPASAAEIAQREMRIADAKVAASGSQARLLLLGTAGGPVFWTNTNRRSTSSALVVGDALYLIDCGDGVGKRLQEALDPPSERTTMKDMRAIFLTHLHSDHTVDYPNILLYGMFTGLDRLATPLKVFGPGRRGEMEPIFAAPGRLPRSVSDVNPDNPTPGTADMTNYLYQAFATDLNDRMRDNASPDPRSIVEVHDIELPNIPGFVSPNQAPEPDMEPFKIYEDDRVRVSTTLVNHFPIWPAFAFRFDTNDGSVVFSGDTSPSQNLVKLAKGADILVHEVIVTAWIDRVLPEPRSPAQEALRQHLLAAHTPIEQVGKVAEQAGVSTLVLSHIVPGNARAEELIPAQQDFSGRFVIGEDLLQLGVGRKRSPT
jgi:ribonuclease BN (tRNA processing enzyme)